MILSMKLIGANANDGQSTGRKKGTKTEREVDRHREKGKAERKKVTRKE